MSDEAQHLSQFAANRCEQAFAAIVKLHVQLVFATAFRQLHDRGLAEEVTQNVFVALAQKAGSLHGNRTLAGWLYQTTLNQSRHVLRSELRRQRREEIAATCAETAREGTSTWNELIPLLDEALSGLRETERLAVILHYMEGRPFREVGQTLGLGEDAARKRVNRALDWLTQWFRKRGIGVTTMAVTAALSLEGIPATSGALIASISSAAIVASHSAMAGSSLSTLAIFMASTKTKLVFAGAAVALLVTAPIVLRGPRSTPPAINAETINTPTVAHEPHDTKTALPEVDAQPVAPAAVVREKSLFERINDGDESLSLLSREQAEAFLARNRTNAESLLAAYRVTHDAEYLRVAATNFPNDPAVLFRVAAHNAFPQEKRPWLDQYKKADAENALPYYLSAADYLKNGNANAAFQELAQGTQKSSFQDHVTEHILTLEEIYLAAGHSSAEAKALAACAVELPHLPQINEMSHSLVDLMKKYQQAGDNSSAELLAAMGIKLSEHIAHLQEGGNVLGQIVAVRTERSFLEQLNPSQTYPFLTGTVADRIAAGRAREQSIRDDAQIVNRWIPEATEPDIVNYFDRLKIHGESAAIEWLKNRGKAL